MRSRVREVGGFRPAPARESRSIPKRIAACALAIPNQVAVADDSGRLTYSDLERKSDRLAVLLQQAGAGPERCVGIALERSTQFVVAALAILKTGAAYVPLDPALPPRRLSLILGDAGIAALVTNSRIAAQLPSALWPVVIADQADDSRAVSLAPTTIDSESLAYIVYTSGSTGRPKGVEITHGNVSNLIDWHQSAFEVTAADRASQVASLGFDAAAWEIWPYLTAGASLHIADEATRRSSELLREWLVAKRISIAFVPTALAEQMLRVDWPAETAMRLLLTGGDRLLHRPRPGLPFVVVNNYGPTECTVVASSGAVAPGDNPQSPSIGKPITNATAMILDDALQPLPPGQPGELCISGALVARGYRNMPDVTARCFITYIGPSGRPIRLYRTGDRARLLENGELEFLGRIDEQVKIRGYRIELGEIEAWLGRAPGIAAVSVSVRDLGAERALVAYVVPTADAQPSECELREYLAAHLPGYMIPALFVALRELPLTANGKIDKEALPAPGPDDLMQRSSPGDYREASALERQISDLVASLLSKTSIGEDENFFMIGGHSMFGVQLVAQIRETLGVKLPLRQVFAAPTVRELSREVKRLNGDATS